MTDYEKLKCLLTEFKIGFTEEVFPGGLAISCAEGDEKIIGYPYFFTEFRFTSEGKFTEMGAWE